MLARTERWCFLLLAYRSHLLSPPSTLRRLMRSLLPHFFPVFPKYINEVWNWAICWAWCCICWTWGCICWTCCSSGWRSARIGCCCCRCWAFCCTCCAIWTKSLLLSSTINCLLSLSRQFGQSECCLAYYWKPIVQARCMKQMLAPCPRNLISEHKAWKTDRTFLASKCNHISFFDQANFNVWKIGHIWLHL